MSKLHVDITGAPNEIKMVRTFNAPKRLVVKAMSEPALVKRWLGGKRAIVTDTQHDFRVGGTYKNAFRTPDGHEFWFSGTYLEVTEDRIVHSERFNDDPAEARVTISLVETGGTTTMTMVMGFPSQEIRDMVVSTGMSDGAGESYDELETLLASL